MKVSLRDFRLFDTLGEHEVARLERLFVEELHPSGQVLLREGDRADEGSAAMYLLLEGQVGVEARAPAGGFGVRRTLRPGHVFGAVSVVAEVPRSATCRALGPVRVARLDRASLQALQRQDEALHARLQLVLARALAADVRDLRDLLVGSLASGDERAVQDYLRRA